MSGVNITEHLEVVDANIQGVTDAVIHLATVWGQFTDIISSVDAQYKEKYERMAETVEHLTTFVNVPDEGPFVD